MLDPLSQLTYYWASVSSVEQRDPPRVDGVCGRCGAPGMSLLIETPLPPVRAVGGRSYLGSSQTNNSWLICTACGGPSVRDSARRQSPPVVIGETVELPNGPVRDSYEEARRAMGADCYTSCEAMCRKLLIYLACDRAGVEWERRKSFASYVDALDDAGHLTASMRTVADFIRERGNTSTHELAPVDKAGAERTLRFTGLLLRNLYEMP